MGELRRESRGQHWLDLRSVFLGDSEVGYGRRDNGGQNILISAEDYLGRNDERIGGDERIVSGRREYLEL